MKGIFHAEEGKPESEKGDDNDEWFDIGQEFESKMRRSAFQESQKDWNMEYRKQVGPS